MDDFNEKTFNEKSTAEKPVNTGRTGRALDENLEINKKKPTPEAAKNLRYKRDQDREMVKGIFKYYELQGGKLEFMYRAYAGDPIEKYELVDGQIYTIPLGVARHLNKNGKIPIHSYALDENGKPLMRIGEMQSRFGFQSLEFIDAEEMGVSNSKIVIAQPL